MSAARAWRQPPAPMNSAIQRETADEPSGPLMLPAVAAMWHIPVAAACWCRRLTRLPGLLSFCPLLRVQAWCSTWMVSPPLPCKHTCNLPCAGWADAAAAKPAFAATP